jgi:hypothetical protein
MYTSAQSGETSPTSGAVGVKAGICYSTVQYSRFALRSFMGPAEALLPRSLSGSHKHEVHGMYAKYSIEFVQA